MTTIAANLNSVSADSLSTAGGYIHGRRENKIQRINGCLVGCCGPSTSVVLFWRWFEDHDLDNRPNLEEGFAALVLSGKGMFIYYDDCVPTYSPDMKLKALGSGWEWAESAMHLGKTPAEAVRFAMKFDAHTGGRVRTVKL